MIGERFRSLDIRSFDVFFEHGSDPDSKASDTFCVREDPLYDRISSNRLDEEDLNLE